MPFALSKIMCLRDGLMFDEERIENPTDATEAFKKMPKLEDKVNDDRKG